MATTKIPAEFLAENTISALKLAENIVSTRELTANGVTSAQIAQNSILTRHIDDNQITGDQIADNAVGTDQLAGIARGKIIIGNASGNPALLSLGSNGYVLKSDGSDIAWAADADTAALTSEEVQDIAGAMFTGNTETGITATYQDGDGTVDLVVGTLNQDTTGTAATVTTAAQTNITSLGTLTTLTVDNVVINGTTIGHTGDDDLLTFASGVLTVAGEVSMTTLDIGGTNITSTAAELNYVDGVTSAIQTQMDTKTSTGKAVILSMIFR